MKKISAAEFFAKEKKPRHVIAENMEQILELRKKGYSLRSIAEFLAINSGMSIDPSALGDRIKEETNAAIAAIAAIAEEGGKPVVTERMKYVAAIKNLLAEKQLFDMALSSSASSNTGATPAAIPSAQTETTVPPTPQPTKKRAPSSEAADLAAARREQLVAEAHMSPAQICQSRDLI